MQISKQLRQCTYDVWRVTEHGHRLHRVAKWKRNPFTYGTTCCGKSGWLSWPTVPPRPNLPRCVYCCRAVGIPTGNGAPLNEYQAAPSSASDEK